MNGLVSHTSSDGHNWYYERYNGSDELLICAGDSWTWGNNLGTSRLKDIYGTQLSNKTGFDLINIGLPGECNLSILHFTRTVINMLKKHYKKIYIIFTFTESSRDLTNVVNCKHKFNLKKEEQHSFSKQYLGTALWDIVNLHKRLKVCNNLNEVFSSLDQCITDVLENNFPKGNNMEIICAKNFCHWYNTYNTTTHDIHKVNKIWTDVIAEKGNLQPYPSHHFYMTRQMSLQMYEDFVKTKISNVELSLHDIIPHINKTEEAYFWLKESPYNSSIATKHPNKQGHIWWAEYLYDKVLVPLGCR
jgi:hypothetical protein